jgi:Na+/H+ antiporter NhaC
VTRVLLPLMGLLFTLAVGGLLGGLLFLIAPRLRQWAPFVALPLVLGAVLSFCLSWGSALVVEQLTHRERLASLGFFVGFLLGIGVGGSAGLALAMRVRRIMGAQLSH